MRYFHLLTILSLLSISKIRVPRYFLHLLLLILPVSIISYFRTGDLFFVENYVLNFVISGVLYYSVFRSLGINKSLKVMRLVFLPSIIVGILQGFDMNLAWELREIIPDVSEIKNRIYQRDRSAGLAWYSLLFAYIVLLTRLSFVVEERKPPILFIVILLMAAFFSGTRSVMLALLFIELVEVKRKRNLFLLLVLVSIAALPVIDKIRFADAGTLSRIYSYQVAFEVISKNWIFGLGHEYSEYLTIIRDYIVISDSKIGGWEAMNQTSHNYLLNQVIIWGVPGGLLLIYVLLYPFFQVTGKRMKFAVLIPLLINMMTHNGGLTSQISMQIVLVSIIVVNYMNKHQLSRDVI
jgi:hypothetical protein